MTIIKTQQELEEMTQRAEDDISAGRVYSMKEVYQKVYKENKENV